MHYPSKTFWWIQDGIIADIQNAYPELEVAKNIAVWDLLSFVFEKTGHKFIFVMDEWYDGYYTATGERLYNPRSVVCALTDNQLSNYWVSSGKYDSIF